MKPSPLNRFAISTRTKLLAIALALLSIVPAARSEQAEEAWVQLYGHHSGSSRDEAVKIALDSAGNVIVAGNADIGTNGSIIVVLKYSNAGLVLWTNTFSSGLLSSNTVSDLVLDVNGDILIVGTSDQVGAVAIKYSGSGAALWTNYYQGSGDIAHALAITTNNAIVVTGQSLGSGSGYDQFVIQYSSAGTPMWTNRFNGDVNADDAGRALVIDSEGNIIATGGSIGSSGGWDWLTIKYSNTGTPIWTNRYDSGAESTNQNNFAKSIAADANNDILVAGKTYFTGHEIIKYSAGGTALWTNIVGGNHTSAYGVAVDQNSDVVLVGRPQNGLGAIVVYKYSNLGGLLWTKGYSTAYLGGYALDNDNNVIVTGEWQNSIFTVKLSSSGAVVWTNHYYATGNQFGHAVALAENGNVFVAGFTDESGIGETGYDFVTIKYGYTTNPPAIIVPPKNLTHLAGDSIAFDVVTTGAPRLQYQWWKDGTPLLDATNSTHTIDGVQWSDAGNYFVVVTNNYGSVTSSLASLTVQWPPQVSEAWTQRYNRMGNSVDRPRAVVVDTNGNIFVTGTSSLGGTGKLLTMAYTSAGLPLWTNHFAGPTGGNEGANAIAVGTSGNVYVTGHSHGGISSFNYSDYVTLAYSGAGVPLWTNRYSGRIQDMARAIALVVDQNENVYVTGGSSDGTNFGFATIAYSIAGTSLWTNRYPGGSAAAMAFSKNENTVYVTGSSFNDGSDYTTVAYSSAGVALWTNHYDGPGNTDDYANAIAVGDNGNIYVTGDLYYGNSDCVTIAYSSTGDALWTNRYNGPGGGVDSATALAVASNGNVYVTGYSQTAGNFQSEDYLTIAYSSAGEMLWANRYDGPANDHDNASAVAVDDYGNIFVTGHSTDSATSRDFTTIIYNSSGATLAVKSYNGSGNGEDEVIGKQALAITSDGVVVAGTSDSDPDPNVTNYDFALVKYVVTPPTNQPPGSSGFGATTVQDQPLQLAVSNLLAAITDSEGDAISLVSVAVASTNGAAITQTNDVITYTPIAGFVGADRFNYVVADNQGATNTVAAQIAVLPVGTIVQSFAAPSVSPSEVSFAFTGNPGETWTIERATELPGPWTNVGTILIQANGTAMYQDFTPPPDSGYYRATKP